MNTTPEGSREGRLNAALAEYLEAERLGRAPAPDEFLAAHPELGDELRSFFDDRQRFARAAQPLAAVRAAAAPVGYELIEELGRGGMGVVYKARQVSLNRVVALKRLLPGRRDEGARLLREAEAAASLDHPNVVPIHEVGEHEGEPFLCMKLVEGTSLAQGPKPDARGAAALVAKVARAVHHAHQRGVLHRDLKPSNVLIDEKGEPHVADFGLARRLDGEQGLSQSGAIVGTPAYMAPEQVRGEKTLTVAVDVYGLGAILYELLAGRVPHKADSLAETLRLALEGGPPAPRSIDPGIDHDLETVCLKCLAKEPARRYPSAEAVADDLERWQAGEPILARPTPLAERAWLWARRNPVVASLAGVSGLALLALVVGLAVSNVLVRCAHDDMEAALGRETVALGREMDARADEQAAKLLAQKREGQARAAWESERELGYARSISLARAEWLAGNLFRADQVLAECPEGLRGWEWGYLRRTCRAELLRLDGHDETPHLLAFSRDGKRLATGAKDGTICTWDLAGGKQLHRFRRHFRPPTGLAFTPDGKHVVSAAVKGYAESSFESGGSWHGFPAYEGEVLRWDAETGAVNLRLKTDEQPYPALSPDGACLATADVPGLWRKSPELRRHFPNEKDVPRSVKDCFLTVRDCLTGRQLSRARLTKEPYRVAYSPDGARLAVTCFGGTQVFDARSLELLFELTGYNHAFAPDGKMATVQWANQGRGITLWSADGKRLREVGQHEGHVKALAFHPDGTRLASAGDNGQVRVFDALAGGELYRLHGFRAEVEALAFSPDGKSLATSTGSQLREEWTPLIYSPPSVVQLWDAGASQESRVVARQARELDLSADGKRLAVGDGSMVRVLDPGTGKVIVGLPPLRGGKARFSPKGDKLAVVDFLSLSVVDTTTGKALVAFKVPSPVIALRFSDDGATLAVVDAKDSIAVYDVAARKEPRRLPGDGGGTMGLVFLPDGKLVRLTGSFTAAINGEIETRGAVLEVWDVKAGRRVAHRDDFGDAGRGLARGPDGKKLFAAVGRRVLELDSATLKTLRTIQGYGDVVQGLACGQGALAVAYPRGVKLWGLGGGRELLTFPGSCSAVHFGGSRLVTLGERGVEVRDAAPSPFRQVRGRIAWPSIPRPVEPPAAPLTKMEPKLTILDVVRDLEREKDPRRQKLHRVRAAALLQQAGQWNDSWGRNKSILARTSRYRARLYEHSTWKDQQVLAVAGRHVLVSRGETVPARGRVNVLRVLDLDTSKPLGPGIDWGKSGNSASGALSRDRKLCAIAQQRYWATGDKPNTVQVHDVATGRLLWIAPTAAARRSIHYAGYAQLDFSPDGRYLVIGFSGGAGHWSMQAFEAATGKPLAVDEPYTGIWFSPDGKRFVTVFDSSLEKNANAGGQVWDAGTRQRVGPRIEVPEINEATFSPDGSRLLLRASASTTSLGENSVSFRMDKVLHLWDFMKGRGALSPVRPRLGMGSGHTVMSGFTPDGRQFYQLNSGSEPPQIQFWDAAGKPAGPPIELHKWFHNDLRLPLFSADGRFAVVRTYTSFQAWDLRFRQPVTPYIHSHCWDISPDGRLIQFGPVDLSYLARMQLVPDERPVAELKRLAQALTGQTLDDKGKPRALTKEEALALRKHYSTWPADAEGPRIWRDDSVIAWYGEPWDDLRWLRHLTQTGPKYQHLGLIDEEAREQAGVLLRKLGQGDRWALLADALAHGKSPALRWAAADAVWKLGRDDPKRAAPLLEGVLEKDASEAVRARAAEALSDPVLSKVSVAGLLHCLKADRSPEARARAVAGLRQSGNTGEAVGAALLAACNDPDANVRSAAHWALGGVKGRDEEVLAVLLAARKDSSAGVRQGAVWTLRGLAGHDREVTAGLVAALNDRVTREAAAAGLDHPVRAVLAVQHLARLAQPYDSRESFAALRALRHSLPGNAVARRTVCLLARREKEPMLLLLEHAPGHGDVPPVLAAFLRRLKPHLLDWGKEALARLIKLGAGAKPYVPVLLALLRDEPPAHDDPDASWLALQTLGRLGPHAEEAVPALIDLLSRDAVGYSFWTMPKPRHPELAYPAGIALARIGGKAVPALLRALDEVAQPRIRIGAANALGYCRASKEAIIPRLEAALKALDAARPETPRLRAQIEDSLQRLRDPKATMPEPYQPRMAR